METKKQIVARVTNEVSKRYSQRVKDLTENIRFLTTKNSELYNNNVELRAKYSEALEKIQQYEDWINRLQDFCNLPDNERDNAIKLYLQEKKNAAAMDGMLSMLRNYTTMLFM